MEMQGYFQYGIVTPSGLYLRKVNWEGHFLNTKKRFSCVRETVKNSREGTGGCV